MVLKEAEEEEVNLKKRVSSFFNEIYNIKEQLFIKDDLLFVIRMPKKGERHNFCLILGKNDAIRKLI